MNHLWIPPNGREDWYDFGDDHDLSSRFVNWTFEANAIRIPYHGTGGYQTSGRGIKSKSGRVYHPNPKGKVPEDWWDIPAIPPISKERIGYPTQKPLEFLERIVKACSKKDQAILDPFCGCGTAIVAAEKLNRRWIGIDVTHLAITLVRTRLEQFFGSRLYDYEIIGAPIDHEGAISLANQDRYQFQCTDRRRAIVTLKISKSDTGKPRQTLSRLTYPSRLAFSRVKGWYLWLRWKCIGKTSEILP